MVVYSRQMRRCGHDVRTEISKTLVRLIWSHCGSDVIRDLKNPSEADIASNVVMM